MTIYLAICDDNIADRKHLERLLEREKDVRLKSTGDVLYIDSFGSEEALMRTPIKYDMFFIDMTNDGSNGMELAKDLRKKGIQAPIVLCESTIDYTSYVNTPDKLTIVNKPLSQGQISHHIDVATDWTKRKTPLFELRCQNETHFIPYNDIVSIVPKGKYTTDVSLTDNRIITVMDSFRLFQSQCFPYKCFMHCGNCIVNMNHVTKTGPKGFTLANGDYVKYKLFQKKSIINQMAEYIGTLQNE